MTNRSMNSRNHLTARVPAAIVGLTAAVALGAGSLSAEASAEPTSAGRGAVPTTVTSHVTQAQTALTRAVARIEAHRPVLAIRALNSVRREVALANQAAAAQIGRPPVDPESDDAPGPPSVLAALRLDHKVSSSVVALFDGRTGPKLVQAQRQVLYTTEVRRDAVLDAVIALPAEGDGADYADGLADTLNVYTSEVTQHTTALKTFRLTEPARLGLTNSLDRVRATKAKVDLAFGGGE